MTKSLSRINTSGSLPESTSVVIIGGGIVGVSAALTLAERNIPVVLLEKGHLGCEQSSRNLGWVRKTNRLIDDVPLALAADRLWQEMPNRVSAEVGYKQSGIMFLANSEKELQAHEDWLKSVETLSLDSRMVSQNDIDQLVPGGQKKWLGGIYTPSDGRAEPALAVPAIAKAAIEKGAIISQQCAVRGLDIQAGEVKGVFTEHGSIRCEKVLLAGGAWSRKFLLNEKVRFPTLPLVCSVVRTQPMDGPTEINVGGPDFSFRKHINGGYIITQRSALNAPLSLDHLLIGMKYLPALRSQFQFIRPRLNRFFIEDLKLGRRWSKTSVSPFEKLRIYDPAPLPSVNQEALNNLQNAWPIFKQAKVEETWAGLIEITPDSNPVIDNIASIPGLTIATGMSGHGFGTGPAAGHLAADLVSEIAPIISPKPYRYSRLL